MAACAPEASPPQSSAGTTATAKSGREEWLQRLAAVRDGKTRELSDLDLTIESPWDDLRSETLPLERLTLSTTPAADDAWSCLRELPNLSLLKLTGAVGDDDLQQIADFGYRRGLLRLVDVSGHRQAGLLFDFG